MKHLFNIILYFFFCIVLSAILTGCLFSKKLHKASSKSDTSFVDRSEVKTEVIEKVDTIVYTKADTTRFSVPSTDTNTVVFDTPTSHIEAKYNVKTKKVDVVAIEKAKPIHVLIDRKTNTLSKADIKATGSKKETSKDLKKSNFSLPWWLWLILALIILLILFYKYYLKKQFPFLP